MTQKTSFAFKTNILDSDCFLNLKNRCPSSEKHLRRHVHIRHK
uniref:Uncharacterized protein n=1 Tax=Rhizophora mucronata TaxID=61149 RepID=A0A2P2PMT6_RHIMU